MNVSYYVRLMNHLRNSLNIVLISPIVQFSWNIGPIELSFESRTVKILRSSEPDICWIKVSHLRLWWEYTYRRISLFGCTLQKKDVIILYFASPLSFISLAHLFKYENRFILLLFETEEQRINL